MTWRSLALLTTLTAAACGDVGVGNIAGRLILSPGLKDVGVKPVGVPSKFTVFLDAELADVEITTVSLLRVEGQEAFYVERCDPDAPSTDDTGVITDFTQLDLVTETSLRACLEVGRGETRELELYYFPPEEGFHRAKLTVKSTARNPEVAIDLRGQAAVPEVSIYPWTIDFGRVEVGQQRTEVVTVDNRSLLPVAVSTSNFTPPDIFSTLEPDPFIVEGDQQRSFEITFSPLNDDVPTQGSVTFTLGDEGVQRVRLRGNDCENGLPSAYDRDGDGVTVCGGDCDDRDPEGASVHPGAEEILDNRDNDCDDLIDEGTRNYDDDEDGFTENEGDCNDNDPEVHPDVIEDCPGPADNCDNGIDDDCDGTVDAGSEDGDGDGYTVAAGDCDDDPITGPNTYPNANELPDGVDNDCDGPADEGTALYDDDGDGFCEGGVPGRPNCTVGTATGDCDDSIDPLGTTFEDNPGYWIYPNAPEAHTGPNLGQGVDNDCDGDVDENTQWGDDDGDGYTEQGGDCNDQAPNIGPHVLEIPNDGIDNDCDPTTPVSGPR